MKTVGKVILGLIFGWIAVALICSIFSLIQGITGFPILTTYFRSGLAFPVSLLIYIFTVYKTVTY